MPYGLNSTHEEMHLFTRILTFYSKLYPKVKFEKSERMLSPREIGEVLCIYRGQEGSRLLVEKRREMLSVFPHYVTPVITLRKGRELILLDGHVRLLLAYEKQIPWKALVITPNRGIKLGIEHTITGRIKDMATIYRH